MANTAGQVRESADIHSASDEYAARFTGESGHWLLARQEQLFLGLLRGRNDAQILDIGGGHGQIAKPLQLNSYKVTVLASDPQATTQVEPLRGKGVAIEIGDLLNAPFPEKHFEVVTCFRLLSHCTAWRQLISELCRLAKESVIIDYPRWRSLNAVAPLLFSLKKGYEGNTRSFTIFSDSQIDHEFRKNGFTRAHRKPQFFWPMVVHRALKSAAISEALEIPARVLLLNQLFGSPIIAEYRRVE